ncbi:ATP-binding protein [Streptomyces sp. NPDC049915]|uniref:ATP-binding protein n=1 Tax=Streptomyces sp. NPDC049915 TaxID=3155510 RepID=UPI00344A172F
MTTAQLTAAPREEAEHVFPLPHAPGAVATVRRRVRVVLAEWNLTPEVVADVLLVVSELVTNALVHALPPATLRLAPSQVGRSRAVHIEVTDRGPVAPTGLSASAVDPDEHGRGLGIVTALSSRFGVRVHAGGTTRWAEVPFGVV